LIKLSSSISASSYQARFCYLRDGDSNKPGDSGDSNKPSDCGDINKPSIAIHTTATRQAIVVTAKQRTRKV
jgi:hypothetical protein